MNGFVTDVKHRRFARKVYSLYQKDWIKNHRQIAKDGCIYACFNEFTDCEFADEECMRELLDEENFKLWLSYNS